MPFPAFGVSGGGLYKAPQRRPPPGMVLAWGRLMGLVTAVKSVAKAVLPGSIVRRIRMEKDIKRFRNQYFGRKLGLLRAIARESGETHNFTYDLTDRNLRYLGEMVAVAVNRPAAEIHRYIREAIDDADLRAHVAGKMAAYDGQKTPTRVKTPFARRLGWYAVARAIKPKIVVETGVERGHGAVLLCAALLRNAEEGHPGRYFGTELDPAAGMLLSGKYASTGKILYGDSIMSLRSLADNIDLFVNDSDHSAEYEGREYDTIAGKLSPGAVLLGDNAHVTEKLALFAEATGRRFMMFREEPKDHWYPGAGIGIAFSARDAAN